jgi:TonB family protein
MLSMLLAAMLQAAAPAPSPVSPAAAPRPEVVTSPDWLRRPTAHDLVRLYPREAMRKNVPGRAVISCKVNAEGLLTDCTVDEETPPGEGFGEAALKMAPLFKMRPQTRDGQPVDGGTVRIPLRFTVDSRIDPVSALLACYGQTAAVAAKDPADEAATTAYGFFAAQVAFQHAASKARPEALEMALRSARVAALAGSAGREASLNECLAFAKKATAPK